MNFEAIKLICSNTNYKETKRLKDFWYIKCSLNFKTSSLDKSIQSMIKSEGEKLAGKVFPGAANDSKIDREDERILANSIAGLLAEYCWKCFLNMCTPNLLVQETKFEDAKNQIDLITLKSNTKIEVRSSFPRNGIDFAICHEVKQFDILGPYSNEYKPSEPEKDLYLRTLYHVQSYNDFLKKFLSEGMEIYLTGGATWDMMFDEKISLVKDLIPEDGLQKIESKYRVVPFQHALDTMEILKLIKEKENE